MAMNCLLGFGVYADSISFWQYQKLAPTDFFSLIWLSLKDGLVGQRGLLRELGVWFDC
jgi:hypothetical protein